MAQFILTCVVIVLIYLMKVDAQLLSLTSSPQLNDPICPGLIEFTCVGTRISVVLEWRLNDTIYGEYVYTGNTTRPVSIHLNSLLSGVMAQVTSVSPNEDGLSVNITSTLSGGASILDGSSIQCTSSTFTSTSHKVSVIDISPPPSSTSCSLLPARGPGVSLQWNSSFNSQHAIEMYRVTVIPDPSTCSRDVTPSEDYSCPGLALGTQYTFTVSAINCGDREGMGYTFTVLPQVPQNLMNVEVEQIYDSSSKLREVRVSWRNQFPSISERCDYDRTVNYTVVLESSTGGRVDQIIVSFDSCTDGLCSTSFSTFSSDQTYHVSVSATNIFGESSSTSSMTFNGSSTFNHSLIFDNCIMTLLCSYPSSEGQCFIQYGQDSFYQDLSSPVQGPLNSSFTLPLMDENTFYYYLVNNTFGILFTGNFTTGEFAVSLTPTNQGLLVVGVILLSVATIVGIVLIVVDVRTHKGSRLFLIVLVVGCVVVVLSIVLWVAVGFQVGLQKNTCDTNWQSTRDGLITTAFIFSLLSTLIIIAAGILFAIGYFYFKQDNEHKYCRKESWWHNLLTPRHITSTGRNEVEPKAWEITLEEHKDKLTEGKGGRIIELEEEDLATEGFREVGEKYLDAKLRTQEAIFQEYTAKKAEEESTEVYSVTQHSNTPQEKVNPQDSNYSHLNRPDASMEGDSHYLPLNHDKVGGGAGDSIQKRDVQGGEEYDVINNKHSNTPKVKVNPQNSNYSHMNRPGASVEGDSHYLTPSHVKGSRARWSTSVLHVEGGAGNSIQKRGVPGAGKLRGKEDHNRDVKFMEGNSGASVGRDSYNDKENKNEKQSKAVNMIQHSQEMDHQNSVKGYKHVSQDSLAKSKETSTNATPTGNGAGGSGTVGGGANGEEYTVSNQEEHREKSTQEAKEKTEDQEISCAVEEHMHELRSQREAEVDEGQHRKKFTQEAEEKTEKSEDQEIPYSVEEENGAQKEITKQAVEKVEKDPTVSGAQKKTPKQAVEKEEKDPTVSGVQKKTPKQAVEKEEKDSTKTASSEGEPDADTQ